MSAIVEKVKKLLALATSSNVHEAASAAAKAQELIERHKIDKAALEEPLEVDRFSGGMILEWRGPRPEWKLQLVAVVASVNGCATVLREARVLSLGEVLASGTKEDLETVRYLSLYLIEEVGRLWEAEAERIKKAEKESYESALRWFPELRPFGPRTTDLEVARVSFECGATAMICHRLEEAHREGRAEAIKKAAAEDRFALSRVERAIEKVDERREIAKASADEKWKPQGTHETKNEATDELAYLKGMSAAQKVGLEPPEKSLT